MTQDTSTTYDKWPFLQITGHENSCYKGWKAIADAIKAKTTHLAPNRQIIVFDCYMGVHDGEIADNLKLNFDGLFFSSKDYMRSEDEISAMVYPDVTDDEVFGYVSRLTMHQFFDPVKVKTLQNEIENTDNKTICIYGPGASLLSTANVLVYFDMPRWEIQMRFRRNEVSNLGVHNQSLKASLQYKQAFFVDWRVCDRHKKALMPQLDFIIDTTIKGEPKMITAALFRLALVSAIERPFRLVPFFDPGPWGGQWMKELFDLDCNEKNFAWCFDCVPEENSMLFKFDNDFVFETPAINLVFAQSRKLLGEAVQARFGDEFPIRFDFLDTIGGGNLSLQVHPTTGYIQEKFGMHYTQDESYYMLDAREGAFVYLGLKKDASVPQMISALKEANTGSQLFDADKYVEKWEIKKHDHVLIPAGTIHCSGKDSMVLEISATPFIFTFKLWDWGRLGLDGKPRPINIAHGEQVIDHSIATDYTKGNLINAVTVVAEGDGWTEERTGLHEREFIETRRHWFTKPVLHKGNGSVHVINLVEGDEIIIESPIQKFEPFVVHYAETFIVPASIEEYLIRPHGKSVGKMCATLKAFVRIQP